MQIDFGRAAFDYASHRPEYAPRLFDRLKRLGVGRPGQRVLDLGAGTGLLSRPLADRGCAIVAMDMSRQLLALSAKRAISVGVTSDSAGSASAASAASSASAPPAAADGSRPKALPIQHVLGRAESIPFGDSLFDVVTAGHCWHWFDRGAAPPIEIHRVLHTGGRVAIVYQTYVPIPGSVAEASERLILRHNPGWRHANSTGLNGQVLRDLQIHGFAGIESFSFDITLEYSADRWLGFIRTCSAVGASMTAEKIQQFDHEHEFMLRAWPATLRIPHRVFAAVARKVAKRV